MEIEFYEATVEGDAGVGIKVVPHATTAPPCPWLCWEETLDLHRWLSSLIADVNEEKAKS